MVFFYFIDVFMLGLMSEEERQEKCGESKESRNDE